MESANNEKLAYLNNLLAFMDRNYLVNNLKSFKEIKDIKVENDSFNLPRKLYLK